MEEEILTIRELAKYLKINERTVYLLAKQKKIPGIKIGGSWRFKKEMVDNWIIEQSTRKE